MGRDGTHTSAVGKHYLLVEEDLDKHAGEEAWVLDLDAGVVAAAAGDAPAAVAAAVPASWAAAAAPVAAVGSRRPLWKATSVCVSCELAAQVGSRREAA